MIKSLEVVMAASLVLEHALLLVGAVEDESNHEAAFFHQFGWPIRSARGFQEALRLIRENACPVVVTERDLPDGNWKDVLTVAETTKDPPLVIVASRLADESLWAEVLNLGGYDVLSKPFDRVEVYRTISLAWHRRVRAQPTGVRLSR